MDAKFVCPRCRGRKDPLAERCIKCRVQKNGECSDSSAFIRTDVRRKPKTPIVTTSFLLHLPLEKFVRNVGLVLTRRLEIATFKFDE